MMGRKNFFYYTLFIILFFNNRMGISEEKGLIVSEEVSEDKKFDFSLHGDYFFRYINLSNFILDEKKTPQAQESFGEHRLRWSPKINFGKNFEIIASADILTGQIFGDTSNYGKDVLLRPRNEIDGFKTILLRHFYLKWLTPYGFLEAGQMPSNWGLGLVANDGEGFDDDFGDNRYGDIVERIIFITRPVEAFSKREFAKNFYFGLGGDLVYFDEFATLMAGDRAIEGIGTIFYKSERDFYGVYVAYRNQKDDDGDKISATAFDLYLKKEFDIQYLEGILSFDLEGVFIVGRTTRVSFERAKDGADIMGYGLVFRGGLESKSTGLFPLLEIGMASGDNDIQDKKIRSFSFDPDYRVGMILFEEVLGRMSSFSTDRVSDPNLLYKPPAGYELAATNGSITNAFYIYPKITYTPFKNLELKIAFLYARAIAAVIDPYNSALHGGYPYSYTAAYNKKSLGMELDGGIKYTFEFSDILKASVGFQAGAFFPGDVFTMADGKKMDNVYKIRTIFDFIW